MREHFATRDPRRFRWRARRGTSVEERYRYKNVWALPHRQAHVVKKFQAKGWQFVGRESFRLRTQLTFRREVQQRQWGWLTPTGWSAVLLTGALIAVLAVVVINNGQQWNARYEAWAAARSLKSGDLDALEKHLAENRGNPDFAYYFTTKVTPRDLGDALATVAGTSKDEPFKSGIDPHEYELKLTDLAGVLGLATHGTGDRALPKQWTADFVTATTSPSELYKVDGSIWDKNPFHKTEGEKRRDQDAANKANLLLLLARGYWSSEFLQVVTASYYEYDRREGDDAWPDADPDDDVGYAPAPTGVYLTDGVLALTAALTANPAASEWAFTEFMPGTKEIEDADYSVGNFTHFLLFEHEFPESDGESIGMTAALTALSSAIDSTSWAVGPDGEAAVSATSTDVGPMNDVVVLQALAQDFAESDCSWSPSDYGNCVIDAAEAVWRWVKRWGHLVLDILTVATSFAPPPFNVAAVGTGALNATWYAIEGDYGMAGLSLAAAVPGLAFSKIAKGATAGKGADVASAAGQAARNSDEIATAAKQARAGAPVAAQRKNPSDATKVKVRDAAPKTTDGDFIDPNTGQIVPAGGPFHYGHKPGHEWRCIRDKSSRLNWTERELSDYVNNPDLYQIEDPASNMSHKYEAKTCAR